MADFSNIIEEINTNLPDNNNQSITAAKLRTTLIDLTNTIDNEQDDFESSVQDDFATLQGQVETSLDNLIVDNLTSESTTSALSANQGRILNDSINQARVYKSIDFTSYIQTGYINPEYPHILNTQASYSRSALVPISVFESNMIKITSSPSYYIEIAFIKTLTDTTWAGYEVKSIEYANSTTLQRISANTTLYLDIPSETNYVYILIKTNSSDAYNRTPSFFGCSFDWYGQIETQFDEVDLALKDTTITETKVDVTSSMIHSGYVQSNGTITGTGSTSIEYIEIVVSGYTNVRIMGFTRPTGGNSYYAFYDESDGLVGSAMKYLPHTDTAAFKEFNIPVPEGAYIIRAPYKTTALSGLPNVFYCYLQTGYPAATTFKTGEFLGNVNIRQNLSISYLKDVPSVEAVVQGVTHKMFNNKVDLLKPNIKILDIGNSYTQGITHYIGNILSALNLSSPYGFSLYKYIRSSGSFKTDVDCYNGSDTLGYWIARTAGDVLDTVQTAGGINPEQDYGVKFRKLLNDTDWDIIIIHQVSNYATNFEVWTGTGTGGYLDQLIQILKITNPQAAIATMIVHSYGQNFDTGGGVLSGPTKDRWQKIANSICRFSEKFGIDLVIPYGTAVENLRLSTISEGKNDFCDADNKHLANGIGGYVANCVYYQTLLAPRLGVSIYGNTWRSPDLTGTGVVPINDDTAPLAQKAAMWATYNWYTVTNADNIILY